MFLLILIVSLCAAQPQCRYMCDDPVCPAVCAPLCERPVCQVCHSDTGVQICLPTDACRVQCPSAIYYNNSCPQCETVCPGTLCNSPDCQVFCEAPACSWQCRKPKCPYPQCQLQCEEPVCPSAAHKSYLSLSFLFILSIYMFV